MKEHLDSFVNQLSGKAMAVINAVTISGAVITWSDMLDWSQKLATFIVTLIVGGLSARHYYLKNQKLKREIELQDQELFRIIEENKHRSNGKA